MDLTTLLIGYLIGLTVGALAVATWTKRYGRVSLKSLGFWWRDLADLARKPDPAAFSSRRHKQAAK